MRPRGGQPRVLSSGPMRSVLLPVSLLAAACYQPAVPSGVPCSQSGDCPGGEACVVGVCGGEEELPPGTMVFVAGEDRAELRDTEIWREAPNASHGDQDHISVDDEELSLVAFDLTGVPAGLTLVKATLKVVTTDEADEAGGTVLVHQMLEAWSERDANWGRRMEGTPWSGVGAGPPSRQPAPLAELRPNRTNRPFSVELPVEVVRAWIADPAANHGLTLVRGTSAQHVHFGSRETDAWTTLTLELR